MQLEDEQDELITKFVEGHLRTATENRGPFMYTWPHSDKQATFFHSCERDLSFQGNLSDARVLARLGFLDESPRAGGSTLFAVLPQAIEHWRNSGKHHEVLDAVPLVPGDRFDVFISYASEDRDSISRPIYKKLREKGCTVWFDEAVLELGDSLRQKIDEGLSRCEYGVVILSPAFFGKDWPKKELGGLIARETASGNKAILPVWHNVTHVFMAANFPTLADRVAAKSSDGVEAVAESIVRVVRRKNQEPLETSSPIVQRTDAVKEVVAISEEFANYYRESRPGLESPESAARHYMGLGVEPALLEVTRKKTGALIDNVVIDSSVVGKVRDGESVLLFVRPGYREVSLMTRVPGYFRYSNPRSMSIGEYIPEHDVSTKVIIKKFSSGQRIRMQKRGKLLGGWIFEAT